MKQQQQLSRKAFHFNVKRKLLWRISILRGYLRSIWKQFVACWMCKSPVRYYRHLPPSATASPLLPPPGTGRADVPLCRLDDDRGGRDSFSDLVALKICLFGDCRIGKTSFLVRTF